MLSNEIDFFADMDSESLYPPIVDNDTPVSPKTTDEVEKQAEPKVLSDLFAHMPGNRQVLKGIISAATERISESQMADKVQEMQAHRASVYSAHTLCRLLEEYGALERVSEDGTPFDQVENEPKIITEDGIDYIVAGRPAQLYWQASLEGRAYLEADNPLEAIENLVQSEETYASIYKHILSKALKGASGKSLADDIDDLELVQKPRRYVMSFIKKLEDCDAVTWDGAWHTTEVGKEALSRMADVADLSSVA